ncbi:MAG: glycosyltransferase family 2 protein [candidate division Zixibacteria bacterium]|nr:glycosyltransferase family 2 protein [candidate division Zixibacteria bacterium]
MQPKLSAKTLVVVLTYNEGEKLRTLVQRFSSDREYDLLFIDDGSTDRSTEFLVNEGYKVIRHNENCGVGVGIRSAVGYCRDHDYDVIVVMAGNGKMMPEEIPRLIEPIKQEKADYVQGSRYLAGGQSPNLPRFRNLAIRLFTSLINLFIGFRGTDITCGFRSYRIAILDDPEVNINQDWLGRYEMEYYIHYKAITRGYRVVEAPVSMLYPENHKNYSKIKPLVGWWSMLRPWVFLILKIKK